MSERNNLDRIAPPSSDQTQGTVPQAEFSPQQSQGLQFTVPTEFVDLPSKGKYYPEGHPLKDKTSVEIKFMTAKEEDILASTVLIKKGIVFDRLLQSILVDRFDPNDLLIGDKNAILVASRINGYGHEYQTEVKCPACSSTSKFSFDLSDLKTRMISNDYYKQDIGAIETERGTFKIHFERIDKTVEVKPMTGHDEKRLTYMINAKSKNNIEESLVTDTLKSYIVSVDGETSRNAINSFVDSLPARESRSLRTAYKNIVPRVEISSHYSCANCGHEQELEVPLNTDFFWPNE